MANAAHLLCEIARDEAVVLAALRRDLDELALTAPHLAPADLRLALAARLDLARRRRRALNDRRLAARARPPPHAWTATCPPRLRPFLHRGRYLGAFTSANDLAAHLLPDLAPADLLALLGRLHLTGVLWTLPRGRRVHLFAP